MSGRQPVRRKDGSYIKPKTTARNVAIHSLAKSSEKSTDEKGQIEDIAAVVLSRLRISKPSTSVREEDCELEPRFINYDPKGLIWALKRVQPNETVLMSDIVALILLYLDWGPKTDKIYKLIDEDLLERSRALISRYKVVSGPGKMNDKVITLDLISYAFPEVTANLLHMDQGKVVGKLGPLPRCLASPSGASLIPHTWNNTMDAWKAWAKRFIAIVSRNVPQGQRTNSFKFLVNTEFQEADKMAILRQFGIFRDSEY